MKIVDPDRHVKRLMHQMKTDLRLKEEPFTLSVLTIPIFKARIPLQPALFSETENLSKKTTATLKLKP